MSRLAGQVTGALEAARVLAGGRLRGRGAIVLAYHDIGDDPSNATDYYVSTAQFRKQLRLAKQWGLRLVPLAELTDAAIAGRCLDGLGAVVFDDSLVGVHHNAMGVLLDEEVPATIFTVSAELGSSPPWWKGAARLMTEDEVREMAAAGFTIASHTLTHASLPSLTPHQLRAEVTDSRHSLEDLVGTEVDLFAYPYGHYDRRVREAVIAAGYRAGYSFLNGRVTAGLDRFRLPRLNMWSGQGRLRLAYHLARPERSWPPTQLETVTG